MRRMTANEMLRKDMARSFKKEVERVRDDELSGSTGDSGESLVCESAQKPILVNDNRINIHIRRMLVNLEMLRPDGAFGRRAEHLSVVKGVIMRTVLLLALLFPASMALGQVYQWTDRSGTVFFTDNPATIPAEYRGKAKVMEMTGQGGGDQTPSQANAPAEQQAPVSPSPPPASERLYGGQSLEWWKSSFVTLRKNLTELQDALPAKQEQLTQIHRKWTIYFRAQDRTAWYSLKDEIEKDQEKISELQKKLAALESEADLAGVPSAARK